MQLKEILVLLCVQDNVVAGCKGRENVRAGVFEHGGGGAGVGHEKAETGGSCSSE